MAELFQSGPGKRAALYFGKDTNAHIEAALRDARDQNENVLVVSFVPIVIPDDLVERGVKVAIYDGEKINFVKTVDSVLRQQKDFALVINGLAEFQGIILEDVLPAAKAAAEFQDYQAGQNKVLAYLRAWMARANATYATVDVIDKRDTSTKLIVTRLNVTPGVENHLRTLFPEKVFFAVSTVRKSGKAYTVTLRQNDSGQAMKFVNGMEAEDAESNNA